MSAGAGFPARGRRFWMLTLAALIGVLLSAALGRWQLQRAAQKEAIAAAIARQQALPPLDAAALEDPRGDADRIHRRIRLQGVWLPRHTVYLDNRQMFGRPGFYVFTPLQLASGRAVLVQRGWIARDFEQRSRLAPVQTPAGPVTVEGRIAGDPPRLLDFAAGEKGDSPIRQNLSPGALARDTGLPLVALTVVQTGAAGEGLQREWPAVDSGVQRHHGYAFQWFGLCALIVFLYAWYQFFRRRPSAA